MAITIWDWRGAELATSHAATLAAALRALAPGADLRCAVLTHADLRGLDLRGVDLRGALLGWADLRGADVRGVDFRDADLHGADLSAADLHRADLGCANLRDAVLSEGALSRADLRGARDDLRALFDTVPREVAGLRDALVHGRVDGSVYEGACACLVGTIASTRGCSYRAIPELAPNPSRPAERWALAIRPGDTPDRSQVTAITVSWIDEWIASRTLRP